MLLAWWLRDPLIPYGGDSTGASSFSADSGLAAEPARRAAEAIEAMSAAVQAEHRKLARMASSALAAPSASKEAFDHLEKLPHSPAQGVLLLDDGQATAWAGQTRQTPRPNGPGTSVEFSDFYVTLQVVAEKGARRAIATSLLHAEPPSDGIAKTLESLLAEREFVQGFRYRPPSDTTAGSIITGATGSPLLRLEAFPLSSERMRFATTAAARGKGVSLLALIVFVMIAVGWFDRRKLMRRLFTLAVAAIAVAIIPWNSFSNLSRAFDPAFFYSRLLGPYTASAGVYLMFASLILLAVLAVIRARRTNIPRAVALVSAIATASASIFAARATAQGITLPFWGSTATLWLQWELPVFCFFSPDFSRQHGLRVLRSDAGR